MIQRNDYLLLANVPASVLPDMFLLQYENGDVCSWVIMTNHMHMIAGSHGENKISDIMRDFKKFTSKKILQTLLIESGESRRDWMLNRFEYAGKNDKKITNYKFWQEGNDAQEIYLNDYFNQKLNYIHENPVKAEIVNREEDYRSSSAIDWVSIAIGRERVVGGYNCMILRVLRITNPNSTKAGIANPSD